MPAGPKEIELLAIPVELRGPGVRSRVAVRDDGDLAGRPISLTVGPRPSDAIVGLPMEEVPVVPPHRVHQMELPVHPQHVRITNTDPVVVGIEHLPGGVDVIPGQAINAVRVKQPLLIPLIPCEVGHQVHQVLVGYEGLVVEFGDLVAGQSPAVGSYLVDPAIQETGRTAKELAPT